MKKYNNLTEWYKEFIKSEEGKAQMEKHKSEEEKIKEIIENIKKLNEKLYEFYENNNKDGKKAGKELMKYLKDYIKNVTWETEAGYSVSDPLSLYGKVSKNASKLKESNDPKGIGALFFQIHTEHESLETFGAPRIDQRKPMLYKKKDEDKKCPIAWEIFEFIKDLKDFDSLKKDEEKEKFKKLIEKLGKFSIIILTQELYWVRPDIFCPWDENLKEYFAKYNLIEGHVYSKDPRSKYFDDYINYLEEVHNFKDFAYPTVWFCRYIYDFAESKRKGKTKNKKEAEDKPKESSFEDLRSEEEKVENLSSYFKSKGFYFTPFQISSFYTALKTKGFVILAGLSGTGKTKMAQLFAEGFKMSENLKNEKLFFLSVRPDWRDSKSLIGYYNPIMNRYEDPTGFLKFILNAIIDYKENKDKASPYFVILDEMNLARVEYYFAEFLSVLESGRDEEGFTKEGIRIQISEKENKKEELKDDLKDLLEKANYNYDEGLKLPPNLYFIGTVNIDETTFMFSPKVLDRAFVIEFKDVNFKKYIDALETVENSFSFNEEIVKDFTQKGEFLKAYSDKNKIKEALDESTFEEYLSYITNLSKNLEPYSLHFGYRVLDEIALFYKNAKEAEKNKIISFKNNDEIFDLAILMKVLPKFHGNRAKLEAPLYKVLYWCKKPEEVEEKKLEDIKSGLNINKIEDIENKIKELKNKIYSENRDEESKLPEENKKSSQSEKEGEAGENKGMENSENKKSETDWRFSHTALKVLEMLYELFIEGYAGYL